VAVVASPVAVEVVSIVPVTVSVIS